MKIAAEKPMHEQQPSLRDTLAANQTKADERSAELPTPTTTDKPKTIDE
ncbi:MAG: hypothetical protein FWC20_08625 [Oscillospiraceae bacterium]|nr:hypothetical protein [Oscillospiraceae bacterium]